MPRPYADLVIVGAGSAGAVIAARATERRDRDVMLLEAGPDYPDAVPDDLRDGRRNSLRAHDWGHRFVATPGQVEMDFPRGRVVGGSSAVNTCIALRGQPADYDEWASRGLDEWSWEHCLPAFKRLEHDQDIANEWHGTDGPIPIRRHRRDELVQWQSAFLDACDELGFPRCNDTNDPTTTGAGPHAMNKIDGVRMSAARCYLTRDVRARDNIRIASRTHVRRVVFDNRRVRGVEVEDSAGRVAEIAARTVVLSSGAIATPGILLRSGIGPRATVERLGVSCVADVPAVGARLLDHPGGAIFLVPKRPFVRRDDPLIQTVLRIDGPGTGFHNDVQIQPGSNVPFPHVTLPVVSLMFCIGKPRGHGTLTYTSADPHAHPRIDSQLVTHPDDHATAHALMRRLAVFARTRALGSLATSFYPLPRTLDDPTRLTRALPRFTGSGYHPSGTVPMGREGDARAATDGRGRVRGVEGLVVADASLFPTIPTANTNLATLMVGERFGAWLRDGTH